MANRKQRASVAAETVAISQGGDYLAPSGATVSIYDAVQLAVHKSVLITPRDSRSLRSRADQANDRLLERPWEVTIITAPAPNAGAIATNDPESLDQIEPTFRRRIEQVLSAAVVFDQTALVLGAWGCGVFGNDPVLVARLFGEYLLNGGAFAGSFEHVAFAVLDRRGDTFAAFAEVFSGDRAGQTDS